MKTSVIGGALLAISVGGCNTVEQRMTKANTPVIAYAFGMYTDGSCWAWEPPDVSVTAQPAHGRVSHSLVKSQIQQPGSKCHGQLIDYRVSIYTPNPGFRGQDKFSLSYDGIRNDGGGRFSSGKDVVVDVK